MRLASLLPTSLGMLVTACHDVPTNAGRPESQRPLTSVAAPGRPANVVVQWNRALLQIVRTPGAQPPTVHSTRSFAMLHAAIYDAVNAIGGTHEPYLIPVAPAPRFASPEAAAASAAHDILVALYPGMTPQLDQQLDQSLGSLRDHKAIAAGIEVGRLVASRLVAARSNDGSAGAPVPFVFGREPGDYQSTPPNFPAQPVFTHWSHVRPFALTRADQFRPAAPPPLTSAEYARSLNEVEALGVVGSTAASADEAVTGRFWNGPIQNYWNEIAQSVALDRHLTIAESARLFALLDITIADGVIAFYDAKYAYARWRPITAIRAADSDGNATTAAYAGWLPEVGNTPADPTYPGAHSVISAGAAAVLTSFLGRDRFDLVVTSEVLPGVTRSFASLSGAAEEAGLSRIFAGVHFRDDHTAGARLGRDVAEFVAAHFLRAPGRGPASGG